MKKTLVAFAFLMGFAIQLQAQITLEEIWKKGTYAAQSAGGFHFMPDGESYYSLIYSKEQPFVVRYELSSGKALDTIMRAKDFVFKSDENSPSITIKPSQVTISPDGKRILIATEMEAIYRHSTVEKNYIYFLESKKMDVLSIAGNGKQRYAQFSPDGLKVAYIVDNNMYYADLQADEITEVQLTKDGAKNQIIYGATDWVYEEEFGINRAFYWSPDSRRLAFYRFDESNVKQFTLPIYKNETYPVSETYRYPKAGEDNAAVSVQVMELENRKVIYDYNPIKLKYDAQSYYIPRVKWTQSSNYLCVELLNRLQNNLDVLLLDMQNATSRVLLNELSKTAYVDVEAKGDAPIFLEDQTKFIWVTEESGWMQAQFRSMIDGHVVSQIGNFENRQMTHLYAYDEKKKLAFFQVCMKPYEKEVVAVNGDNAEIKITANIRGNASVDFSDNLKYAVYTYSDVQTPPVVKLINEDGSLLRILEDNANLKAKLAGMKMNYPSFFEFTTVDGTTLYGYNMKPSKMKKKAKCPVFMTCYGGPGSAQVEDRWGGANFMYFQYLTDLGYGVVCVDNRGTGNRGAAFKQCTYLKLGEIETIDQIEAAKYIGKNWSWVDAKRISMFGWSYGGFMASNCILKGADVFKCAIAVAPVTDWRFYDNIYTERYMQTPALNASGYQNTACTLYADNLKGKFLLMHGTADDNVHFQNSMELTNALFAKNKSFEQYFFPNKNHSIAGGYSRWLVYDKMTKFLQSNL